MKPEQRPGLQGFYGKRETFSGVVERIGIGKRPSEMFPTVLLREIRWCGDGSDGSVVADHVWMRCDDAGRYKQGDQLTFSAVVDTYRTGYRIKKNQVNGKTYRSFGFKEVVIHGE